MKRGVGLVLVWLLVTGLSATVAAGAVRSVRDAVTDRPSPLAGLVPTTPPTDTSPPASTAPTSSTSDADLVQVPASSTTISVPSAVPLATATTVTGPAASVPTTSTAPPPTPAPTTSSAPTSSTSAAPTTTAGASFETATYSLIGGWVTIRHGGGEVHFLDAGASAGFTVDLREAGPDEVEVRFRSPDHESRFEAEVEHGEVTVEIEEGDDE